jgi:3-hydroxyisobutyrate dehydrogenase-like beta-hydroxyacid dehydrogenase
MQECQIGVIGVGHMGNGIAASYLRAGLRTGLYDVNPLRMQEMAELDAELAASPADLAAHCDLISIVIRGEDRLNEAAYGADGLLAGARAGTTLVIHTSANPVCTRELGRRAAEQGVQVIEATMTGGMANAAKGSLTLMFAGDPALVEACWPKLRHAAKRRIYVGALGAAGVCKAIQDTLFGLHHQTTHEMLQLAVAAGVEPDRLFEAVCAKGWLLERWAEFWTPDGAEMLGGRSQTTPRMPLEGFMAWLEPMAAELGVDLTTSKETAARSIGILAKQDWGGREYGGA